jgi:hypothetical protein
MGPTARVALTPNLLSSSFFTQAMDAKIGLGNGPSDRIDSSAQASGRPNFRRYRLNTSSRPDGQDCRENGHAIGLVSGK